MVISNERMAHMHGVAEWMYAHAEEYGCKKNKEEMYILGLLHDIGYIYGKPNHEKLGAQLIGPKTDYADIIAYHGSTPQEYMNAHQCFDPDIPKEMILLWVADMMIDSKGEEVGFQARLMEIEAAYGNASVPYKTAKAIVDWLHYHNVMEFLSEK